MRETLEALGFERFRAHFAPYAERGFEPGRVLRVDRGSSLTATEDAVLRAEPSERLRKEAIGAADMPSAGDWVALHTPPGHDIALVEGVLPRSSAFARGDPGNESDVQVLAANIDVVFVVHPIAEEPNVRRLERELSLAWESGATPVVVLNKADLSADPEAALAAVGQVAFGVDVHLASAETGDGLGELLAYADGHRTVALIGPSGAGKSTIVNALLGQQRQATREVRVSDGRGRHTTVARELIPLPNGGVLIDTPGLRALAMADTEEGIAAAFPEIEALAESCRFRDCTHTSEPACGVLAAVEAGDLPAERLESYLKLIAESRSAAVRSNARLKAEQERKWKIIHKAARRYFKDQGQR